MNTLSGVISRNTREGTLLNTASSKQNKKSGELSIAHSIGQSVGQNME